MHTSRHIIFSLMLILAGCLIMGCSSLPFLGQPQQATPSQISGFTAGNQTDEPSTYNNFENVISDLAQIAFADSNGTVANGPQGNEIVYISARELDTTGNASSWIFAVRHANTTSIVTYNHYGRTIVSWPAGFSGTVISTDQIVTPRGLIDHNRVLISGNQSTNETLSQGLVLENGTYTLTQSGQGTSRTLMFNATTGVQIASQE
jgi:hypothetical protein